MMESLLESDFRSPVEGLVWVIPGRELESIDYALRLREEGCCDGIFVQGEEIQSWSFLAAAAGLDRYVFSDVAESFKRADLTPLARAKVLSISGISRVIDFSVFERLEELGCQWNPRNIHLGRLDHLRVADLWGIGSATRATPLNLPGGVSKLGLVRYGRTSLDLSRATSSVEALSVIMARSLESFPKGMNRLRELEMRQVGREHFAYETIPSTVTDLWVESCAPVEDWSFMERDGVILNRFVMQKNKYVEPPGRVKDIIRRIPNRYVPFRL